MKSFLETEIEKLLQNRIIVEYQKNIFVFQDQAEMEYYSFKREVHSSSKGTNSKRIFAIYYIIDLIETQNYEQYSSLFDSPDIFSKFQSDFLSNAFFYEKDYLRYNLYLIFLCHKNNKIRLQSVANDYNYARKLVFSMNDFKEYFSFFSKKDSYILNSPKAQKEMLKFIKSIVNQLEESHAKSLLTPNNSFDNICNFCLKPKSKMLDSYHLNKQKSDDFIKEYFYPKVQGQVPQVNRVKKIDRIVLENFRNSCFKRNDEILTGIVNIIYGDNTAGKSSVLDAIEFGFTGETHKNKDNNPSGNALVRILGTTGTYISSIDAKRMASQLKNYWYTDKIGELNDLFCKINYFNTDATYRFALEDGNIKDAIKHIRDLLCDSKLIQTENDLINSEKLISMILDFLSHTNKNNKKHQEKNGRFRFLKKDLSIKEELQNNNKKQIEKTEQLLETCISVRSQISDFIDNQLKSNLELINLIYHRLFSFDSDLVWSDHQLIEQKRGLDEKNTIQTMSTAQKICLALSVIFCQFFISESAPRFILLDESVANFDYEHLLNLLDFLRDIAINDIQVFFTTANPDIAKICNNKFSFFDNYYLYNISIDLDGTSKIEQKNR